VTKRENASSPASPTKQHIEPLLRGGMSAGEIAKQFGVGGYVITNAMCRLWPEFRGSIKRIRESLGHTRLLRA
jgi:transposase